MGTEGHDHIAPRVEDKRVIVGRGRTATWEAHSMTMPGFSPFAISVVAVTAGSGCASVSPPFDKMKDASMTVLRLQNFEAPSPAQPAQAPALGGLSLPPQIAQWITAGASLLPPGLLPPGLVPGATATPPPAADAPRFHGFRILEGQPVSDASTKGDVIDLFGHGANFQDTTSNCMFAEFGFAMAQPGAPAAEILVSLSCEQVQGYNFTWPYGRTGITPAASQKVVSIAQRVFQGR
jgi:hypothetical protein